MISYQPGVNIRIDYRLNTVAMTKEQLKNLATELVQKNYGSNYKISEIIVFKNSPYYIAVKEINSKHAAFEVLLDPNRKTIYSNYGPQISWNTKYGSTTYGVFGMSYMNES
jgi:hypothetical protein